MLAFTRQPSALDHPFIERLIEFGLDADEFVLFGSAPMLAHGLRNSIRDLDVVARGSAWQYALAHGTPGIGAASGDPVMHLWRDRLQFSQRWISPIWDTDKLIDNAEIIEGIRFARLADVLAYKRALSRPKDIKDIRRILRSNRAVPELMTWSPSADQTLANSAGPLAEPTNRTTRSHIATCMRRETAAQTAC